MIVRFKVENKEAVVPRKGTLQSVGYDLTAISEFKRLNNSTVLYDTGIKVFPPDGYYTEILPRSSLSKSGYVLANSVGVIDPDYTGNLLIALKKVDQEAEDLTLPFKCCQLILRKHEEFTLEEITEYDSTTRGEGGFGSTG